MKEKSLFFTRFIWIALITLIGVILMAHSNNSYQPTQLASGERDSRSQGVLQFSLREQVRLGQVVETDNGTINIASWQEGPVDSICKIRFFIYCNTMQDWKLIRLVIETTPTRPYEDLAQKIQIRSEDDIYVLLEEIEEDTYISIVPNAYTVQVFYTDSVKSYLWNK